MPKNKQQEEMSGELVPNSSGDLVELTIEQQLRKHADAKVFHDFVVTIKHRLFSEAMIGKPAIVRSTQDIVEPVGAVGSFINREEVLGEFIRAIKAKNPRGLFAPEIPRGCEAHIIDNAVRAICAWDIDSDLSTFRLDTNVIK